MEHPKRQVVDLDNLHEMVTAVCYTPDDRSGESLLTIEPALIVVPILLKGENQILRVCTFHG